MNTALATKTDTNELMESVLVKGDLSKLTPQERTQYYLAVCDSVGLNPVTKPFEYITLNNKLTLYALRNCTDQLRTIHGVSVLELIESEREGVFIVTAKVQNKEGRTDAAKGAVTISGLKGDALANAMMKAETKAKRRATLSICGLGLLDETEVDTIPGARLEPTKTNSIADDDEVQERANKDTFIRTTELFISQFKTVDAMTEWWQSENQKKARRDFELTPAEVDALKAKLVTQKEAIEGKKAA